MYQLWAYEPGRGWVAATMSCRYYEALREMRLWQNNSPYKVTIRRCYA